MPVGLAGSPNTTPEAARVQIELLRRAAPARRFQRRNLGGNSL